MTKYYHVMTIFKEYSQIDNKLVEEKIKYNLSTRSHIFHFGTICMALAKLT